MAETLLPDVLPDDHTCPTSYSINGRALTDDAVDIFLAAFTTGKVTEDEDKVGPHSDLLPAFPYLTPPHSA